LVYDILRKKGISDKDRKILKWLDNPNETLRQQDYQIKYFNELSTAIEGKKSVFLRYSGRDELTYREVLPERLFRRGEHVYLEAFCLKRSEYRRFRLDRVQSLRLTATEKRFTIRQELIGAIIAIVSLLIVFLCLLFFSPKYRWQGLRKFIFMKLGLE
jgi:predicted DNA-binding transcriptional regulator YafY